MVPQWEAASDSRVVRGPAAPSLQALARTRRLAAVLQASHAAQVVGEEHSPPPVAVWSAPALY